MATTASDIAQRAEHDLLALHSLVDDLDGLDEEWDILGEAEQVSLSLEWDHLMADVLTELDEYSGGGLLSQDQEGQYRELKGKLKDRMPLISKLKWYRPPVALWA